VHLEDTYDPESWEDYYWLYDKEDWVGLLKLSENDAKKHPADLYAQQRYAEALNLNKKYQDTINFITPLYEKNFESGFGIKEIIDALYGLGKTENNFKWIKRPTLLKLDSVTLDLCIKLLRPKRKLVSITDIYCDLILNADYCFFNESELGQFLVLQFDIFNIQRDNDFIMDSKIKLKRK
jgi:hypothetical protein